MNKKLANFLNYIEPYKGILLFLFLLFFFHFFWKIAVEGDMGDEPMRIFGKEYHPAWFDSATLLLAKSTYWLIRLFPGTENLILDGTLLYFTGGGIRINIVWGCTGIKQMFIFTCIMLLYRGPFLKKLWYIPLGCIVLSAYNIIRMAGIVVLTNQHPERFDSLHDGIFRYIYYGLIFLLWVIWEEFIVKKQNKHEKQLGKNTETEKGNAV